MKLLHGFSPEKIRNGEYSRSVAAPLAVLAVFILIRISARADTALTRENAYAAEILLQLLIFLFPGLLYMLATGGTLKSLRIRPFGAGHLLLILSALIALLSGGILISLYCSGYDSLTGGFDLYGVFNTASGSDGSDTAYVILAYAFVPAVCEEFFFRALLCSEYEKRSTFAAILMPSLFFAMLHFDFVHFPALLFQGLMLALTMYACRSVLASFAVHFLYNLCAAFGKPYFQTLYDLGGKTFFIFMLCTVFLISLFCFCEEAARLYKLYSEKNLPSDYREMIPPYGEKEDNSRAARFAIRHPRLTASFSSFLSPTALICYIFYTAVIFLG